MLAFRDKFRMQEGSGAVGRACLRQRVLYVAAFGSEARLTWLGNALDREACELITTEKSPRFEADLAESIKTRYQHVFDQMEEMNRFLQEGQKVCMCVGGDS